jgi:hypothetical protein
MVGASGATAGNKDGTKGLFPPSFRQACRQKKTAALGVGTRDGGNLVEKLAKTSNAEFRAKAPRLASLRLKGLFTDEGHFYGWEVAR